VVSIDRALKVLEWEREPIVFNIKDLQLQIQVKILVIPVPTTGFI
jgi:hypothetical protein